MPYNDNGKNAKADGIAAVVTHIGVHTGDPGTTGANEATGGSPAYARKPVSWAAASGGQRASSNAQLFDLASGVEAQHFGLWSALTTGTFYGYFPVGAQAPQSGTVAASTDTITSYGHGLSNAQRVMVFDVQGAGVPAGLTEGVLYHVIGATTDTFQLSTTSGGSAVNVTADGEVFFMRCVPETGGAQWQLSLPIGAAVIDERLA